MADDTDSDDVGSERQQDLVVAERFAELVKAAGGSTAAARILKRSRGAVEKWASGKARLPFSEVLALAMHLDGNLNRFAIGGDESAPASSPVPVFSDAGSAPEGFVVVPTFDVQASAGNGAVAAVEPESSELVAFRHTWLRSLGLTPGRVHILWATGDSMNPTIRDGDMLLIDRTIDRVVNDGIYVVVAGGAVRVKRIYMRQNGSVVLRSDNDRYPEEVVPADEVPQLVVEGRVRWVGGVI